MLTIFAGIARFERECLLERQAEGIALAKQEGRMGRPKTKVCDNFQTIVNDWKQGNMTAVEAMKRAGMSKATFYRVVKHLYTSLNQFPQMLLFLCVEKTNQL